MQKNILWIFVAAAFGNSHCDGDYDGSGSDSAMTKEENRCTLPLDLGSRGWQRVKGYFYDQKRDECRLVYFSNQDWDKTQNRFRTLSECRKTCRGGVPSYCFEIPPRSPTKKSYPMITYNSSHGACEGIPAQKYNPQENIFKGTNECNLKCRDPELGQCAPTAPVDCGNQEGGISYRYNVTKQSCEKVVNGECGPFTSFEECSQRCGRYILKKCSMPALTSRYCDSEEVRYWYSPTSKKCEEITGCADDVTNFKTAQDCWETCSSAELTRCLRPPDLGRLRVGAKHYYYDIKGNKCRPTTHMAFWQRTSNKNRFPSFDECERTCKPKHQGTVKKL
uniref:Putative salivary kunitz domain protein n=1 Tax=Ixodes ricinus TaxID=34613 RepID=A0A0K8RE15_IXORI